MAKPRKYPQPAELAGNYAMARYYALKAEGRCTVCGELLPEEQTGRSRCRRCAEYKNRADALRRPERPQTFRERYQRLKAAGKCVQCGKDKEPERQSRILCSKCAERRRKKGT